MKKFLIGLVALTGLSACDLPAQNALGGIITGLAVAAIAEREGAFD